MLAPTRLVVVAAEQARAVPPAVVPAPSEATGRRLVYARSTGLCERCGRAWGEEWHHRQNRSQGGSWCPSNGLHLCHDCHADIGAYPALALVGGFLVRRLAIPANQPVRLHLHGWALLNVDGTVHALTDRSIF